MSLTENSNQVFLPGGATNSQNSPYISVWPLDQFNGLIRASISDSFAYKVAVLFKIVLRASSVHAIDYYCSSLYY